MTALFMAPLKGHIENVKKLPANGADVNVRSDGGSTPLIMAADEGYPDGVKELLDKGPPSMRETAT